MGGFAAAKTQVIVLVAGDIHNSGAMPEGSSPATVVIVRVELVEDKPASLHFGHSIAALACHLLF